MSEAPWQCVECREPLAGVLTGDLECEACEARYGITQDCCGGPLIYLLPKELRRHYEAGFGHDPRNTGRENTCVTELYFRQCGAYAGYAGDREACLRRTADHRALATALVEECFPAIPALDRPFRLLEIGAGHCSTLAAIMRKEDHQGVAYALDFSDVLLKDIAPFVIEAMGVANDRVVKVVGTFEKLPFADGYFDVLVADSSLHHAENLGVVLEEGYRVLRNGGILYAQRETFLSLLRARGQVRRHKRTADHQSGAVENIYASKQWRRFFATAGFGRVDLIPVGTLAVHKMTRYRSVGRLYNRIFRRPLWRQWALGRRLHGLVNRLAVPAFVIVAYKPEREETSVVH